MVFLFLLAVFSLLSSVLSINIMYLIHCCQIHLLLQCSTHLLPVHIKRLSLTSRTFDRYDRPDVPHRVSFHTFTFPDCPILSTTRSSRRPYTSTRYVPLGIVGSPFSRFSINQGLLIYFGLLPTGQPRNHVPFPEQVFIARFVGSEPIP